MLRAFRFSQGLKLFLGAGPGKLFTHRKTHECPLKINGWKMYFLLKYSLLRGRVSFRGCRIYKESIIKGLYTTDFLGYI